MTQNLYKETLPESRTQFSASLISVVPVSMFLHKLYPPLLHHKNEKDVHNSYVVYVPYLAKDIFDNLQIMRRI